MGIFIRLSISKAVTEKEWEAVYKETVRLVKHFPLAERRKVKIHGVDTICLVKTRDREHVDRWGGRDYGWAADGDMEYMKMAEEFFLPRDLVSEEAVDPKAGDAVLGALCDTLSYDTYEKYAQNSYGLWDRKTQGEPYHLYLLAIACLIESRLGTKAFVHGDITRGQCRKAVELANAYLKEPIEMPDRCYMDRLFRRVEALDLTEEEKVEIFENLYLGTKDAEFGDFFQRSYSAEAMEEYWRDIFKNERIGTFGFDEVISEYLLWGFDIDKVCEYVNFADEKGNPLYAEFVTRIMDAKLHLQDKNCADPLKINAEEERLLSN